MSKKVGMGRGRGDWDKKGRERESRRSQWGIRQKCQLYHEILQLSSYEYSLNSAILH
jgi:hypothetical protein